jgi:adenosylhomocysteine nucleosidase
MKIGIMGAMIEEVALIKAAMTIEHEETIADRTYCHGQYHGQSVVLAFSRWGKVASAITATTLLARFEVDMIIFTGVAGAVSKTLHVGDVVIAEKLYQHDMNAEPIFPRFQIPLTTSTYFQTRPDNIKKAKSAALHFVKHFHDLIPKSDRDTFALSNPKVVVGTIASGDQFVADPATRDTLHPEGENVLAVEMEGAAVAQVCEEHEKPYLIIRTISDDAGSSAHIDFQAFVKNVASHYSEGIVSELVHHMATETV